MLSFRGMDGDKYKIYDSYDKVTELVTYDELLHCVTDLGIPIRGVIYSKRTSSLFCEDICSVNGKSLEFYKEELFNACGDEYSIIGEYSPSTVRIKHKTCGYEFNVRPGKVLIGRGAGGRCPKCCGQTKWKTKNFKEMMKKAVGDEYTVLSECTGAHSYVTLRHNKCGLEYNVRASQFLLDGSRCPTCATYGMPATPFAEVARRVEAISKDYKLLEFTRMHSMSKFLHITCGNEFMMKTDTFLLRGGSCPICRRSIPERLLQLELSKWFKCKFNYISDKLYKQSGYRMEFDVYIPSIRTAIEYDGEFYHAHRLGSDVFKDNTCNRCGVRIIRLREYKLPRVNSSSIQICANTYIALRYYIGVEEFERMMTELLHFLGVDKEYHLDFDLLSELCRNKF